MSASIFNGTAIKILKNILRTKAGVEIITGDSDDPTVVAKNAPASSIYLRSGTNDIYVKNDAGLTTNWSLLALFSDIPAAGANRNLSNLLSPTSFNQNLLPAANNTYTIGTTSNRLSSISSGVIFGSTANFYDSGFSTVHGNISGQTPTLPSGISTNFGVKANAAFSLGLFTDSTASNSGQLRLETGNSTGISTTSGGIVIKTGNSTNNNSGDITLQSGTAGGSRGNIFFNVPSLSGSSVGYVWTLQDTATGRGAWVAGGGGGGANTSLSNLVATSINQSLLFDSDGAYDIGDNVNRLSTINSYTFAAYTGDSIYYNGSGQQIGKIQGYDDTLPDGSTTVMSLFKGQNNPGTLGIFSQNQSSGTTNSIAVETGNNSGGASGGLILRTGTASTTRGQIQFVDGSEGVVGYIWTSTSVNGHGQWASPAATFAPTVEYRTLTAGEIAAKQITLAGTPETSNETVLDVIGGAAQEYSIDYTVSGAILDWNGLGLDGVLIAGDRLRIIYWT